MSIFDHGGNFLLIHCPDDLTVIEFCINITSELSVGIDEKGCKSCDAILKELEDIDDETDEAGIQFVKTTDTSYAKSLDIHVFPVVVYFEKTIPIVYNGKHTAST